MRSYSTVLGTTALSVLIAACGSESEPPVREDYGIHVLALGYRLIDESDPKDGGIDVMVPEHGDAPHAEWIAEGHISPRFPTHRKTRTMTPRIQELANQAANVLGDLGHEIDMEKYREESE
jgi:hypothetical protein